MPATHIENLEDRMLALPHVPGDCVEPMTTAFRIAAIANEVLLLANETLDGEELSKIHNHLLEAFAVAWDRAGDIVSGGNWPTTRN